MDGDAIQNPFDATKLSARYYIKSIQIPSPVVNVVDIFCWKLKLKDNYDRHEKNLLLLTFSKIFGVSPFLAQLSHSNRI